MNMKLLTIFLVVVGLLAAMYILQRQGLIQGFQNPSEPTFTMYYAPWCGHCKTAKPDFDSWAAQGPVKVGEKSCVIRAVDPEKQPEIAKGKPIRGFPTFLLELPNGTIKEYKGARSSAAYTEFINKELGSMPA